jgi:hypothetical protein
MLEQLRNEGKKEKGKEKGKKERERDRETVLEGARILATHIHTHICIYPGLRITGFWFIWKKEQGRFNQACEGAAERAPVLVPWNLLIVFASS